MSNWRPINGFDPYEVSDEGEVRNGSSNYKLGIYKNASGVPMVVMRKDGKAYCRAVNRLVANAFIGEEDDSQCPVPIDGDKENLCADNLVWKPRWFAHQMTIQKKRKKALDSRAVMNLTTGEQYENAMDASQETVGMENMILLAARSHGEVAYRGEYWTFI